MRSPTDAEIDLHLKQGVGRAAAFWAIVAFLALLPMLLVRIPPLLDAPGHLAQYAIQAAPPGSSLRRYFDFHWGLRLNLGCDLLVEGLRHALGLLPAFWLVVASIPVLTVSGVLAMGRWINPGRAATASWALLFAYSYPYLYGFLNFTMGMALSLLGVALWVRLARRWRLRAALLLVIAPVLMICHAIGGGLLVVMITAHAAARSFADRRAVRDPAARRAFLAEVWPLLTTLPLVAAQAFQPSAGLDTSYEPEAKLAWIPLALRDQIAWFDIGCAAAVLAVLWLGARRGARYDRTCGAIVAALGLLYVLIPTELTGAFFSDMRLVPAVAIAALALLDWRAAPAQLARQVAIAGFALFAVRIAITATSFVAYSRTYAAEEQALEHIAPGSKVLALLTRRCKTLPNWRMERLDHLPNLATGLRGAWTNAHWDVGTIHLLHVRFRPSPDFYNDPSHYVWPDDCVRGRPAPKTEEERRNMRHTIEDVLPRLPLAKVDYLWLIQTTLPAGPWQARLRPVWSNGGSTLYRTLP